MDLGTISNDENVLVFNCPEHGYYMLDDQDCEEKEARCPMCDVMCTVHRLRAENLKAGVERYESQLELGHDSKKVESWRWKDTWVVCMWASWDPDVEKGSVTPEIFDYRPFEVDADLVDEFGDNKFQALLGADEENNAVVKAYKPL